MYLRKIISLHVGELNLIMPQVMNIPQLAKIRQCPYMEWSRAGVRHPVGHVPWSDGVFYFLLVKAINMHVATYLQEMFRYSHHRHKLQLIIPYTTSTFGRRAFRVVGPKIFIKFPKDIRTIESTDHFKWL